MTNIHEAIMEPNMKFKHFSALLILALLQLLMPTAKAQLSVDTLTITGLNEPYGLTEDSSGDLYVADSGNNQIVLLNVNAAAQSVFCGTTGLAGAADGPSYSALFNNPQGLLSVTLNGVPGMLVSDTGNGLIRFVNFTNGYVTTVAGNTNTPFQLLDNPVGTNASFRQPIGLAQDANGNVYISDWNAIRVMNLNDPNLGITSLAISNTSFDKPTAVAFAGTNQLWVADTGISTVKLITLDTPTNGSMTSYLGGLSAHATGTTDSPFGSNARFDEPRGLLWDPQVGLLISDTGNNTLRLATNNILYGGTNYAVSTFAGVPTVNGGDVDGAATTAQFSSPCGLYRDGTDSYFLADLKNNAVRSIQFGTRNFTPVATPTVGYVTLVTDPETGITVAVFNTDLPKLFNNDQAITIIDADTNGTPKIQWTYGSATESFPDPGITNGFTLYPPYVNDGEPEHAPLPDGIFDYETNTIPSFTIKAMGVSSDPNDRRTPSSLAYGQFTFQVAQVYNSGTNQLDPQHIYLTNITANSTIHYTFDGSDPTTVSNPAVQIMPKTYGLPLYVSDTNYDSNGQFTLRAVGERAGYLNSQPFSQVYFKTNSLYDVNISFGFPSGEASSAFIASPGQDFYAPITLTLRNQVPIYSLQFNLSTTNLSAGSPKITPGDYSFTSFLTEPIPTNPKVFETIPPLMLASYSPLYGDGTPPPDEIVDFNQTNFVSLLTDDTNLNLLSVGWLERAGAKSLYNTINQTLITYSQDHDVTFLAAGGQVVVGGYTFKVPGTAAMGQTYQIQIGRPSATSDGIGGPGSDVFINTPTNGSYAAGAINAIKYVTVGQNKYLVGDAYPFHWFNAGDFGDGVLDNAAVEQVFEAAIYKLNQPPAGSDFFDALDSCGNIGATNSSGVYVNSGSYSQNYPSTNYISFPDYTYLDQYSNIYSSIINVSYSNIVDVVNNLTNAYATTNVSANFSTNYLSAVNTTTTTPINFIYLDPTPGVSTFTTNRTDVYYAGTNFVSLITNVISVTVYSVSNGAVISTNYSSSSNVWVTLTNGPATYASTTHPSWSQPVSNYNINHLFDGNDTTVNTIAFGDGQLDVCDVYVTFRRSLDPSLTWFQRYWSQGQRVATTRPNAISSIAKSPVKVTVKNSAQAQPRLKTPAATVIPQVNFSAGMVVGTPGKTVEVPISATILGNYPLRVLMLSLTVTPLDGAPDLTNEVQFIPEAALGNPTLTDSLGNENYAGAWLDSTIAGLTNAVTVGTLVFTIPATAPENAAYAVTFDHASASPNGLASFPIQISTGLAMTSAMTNSTYGDGIPDWWRLLWFGTVNNLLSVSNVCPSGDGVNNWMKYLAGVNPNVANNFPSTTVRTPVPAGYNTSIQWPSVNGRQYVIMRASDLFHGPWTILSTNNGTGSQMEFDDTDTDPVKFYRVEIRP
jgi:hypothetical protein